MKKNCLFGAVAMAMVLMAAGCQKNGLDIIPEEPVQETERTDGLPSGAFLLTTEKGDTKTGVYGTQVLWVVGDVVNVNGNDYAIKNNGNQFYIEPGADNTPLITGDEIYGYYNCGDVYRRMTTNPQVTIPSEYNWKSGVIELPMAAYGDKSAGTIQFKQLTAAISLTITNSTGFPLRMDEVTLSSTDSKLSGSKWLSLTNTTFGLSSESGSGSVKLNIQGNDANNQCILSNGKSITVQVPILPVSSATINILVRANSNYYAVTTNQNVDADDYYGVPNTDYEFRYSYTPPTQLTLSRNELMTASVTLKRASESEGRVTEVDHGLFTAAANNYRIVRFSKGNLRYQATANSDKKWTFHDNQYDIVGKSNENIGENYSGYIDLFGWATSGHNNGQRNYQPWCSLQNDDYYHAAGAWSTQASSSSPWLPTTLDWAYNLQFENQYNHFNWHTPTKGMWEYLINRDNGNKWGGGTVADRKGCILLPDDWVQPARVPIFKPQNDVDDKNVYTAEEWAIMAKSGAVFLPCTGYREGKTIDFVNSGYYWSSTYDSDNTLTNDNAWLLDLSLGAGPDTYSDDVRLGNAVRLVAYVN